MKFESSGGFNGLVRGGGREYRDGSKTGPSVLTDST